MLCMPDYQIVEVEWIDTTEYTSKDRSEIELCRTAPTLTVGYLLEDRKDEIVIAHESIHDDAEFKNVCVIPKGVIIKRRVLK